jgi:hypothetical protein
LHVLRPAVAVARAFAAGQPVKRDLGGLLLPVSLDDGGPEAAIRLALCFRALALALCAGMAQFSPVGASAPQSYRAGHLRCGRTLRSLAFAPATVFDTS